MVKMRKQVLILTKTYPSPSAKHIETSCVAGIDNNGRMVRIYPVPYRLLDKFQQFSKWQWIDAIFEKATDDARKESYRILLSDDSPKIINKIDSKNWHKRAEQLSKVPTFTSYEEMDQARVHNGVTLAILKPKKIINLEIVKEKNPEWNIEEKHKLRLDHGQDDLFSPSTKTKALRKLPYHFYYNYIYNFNGIDILRKNKIVDWEAGALYWNCAKKSNWEELFRQKFEHEFMNRDISFLMGNIHRFYEQWLIIGVIYPPKTTQIEESGIQDLF